MSIEKKAILLFISIFDFSATFNIIYIILLKIYLLQLKVQFLFFLSKFGSFWVPILSTFIGDYIDIFFILMGISNGIACFDLIETLSKITIDNIPESHYFYS